MEINKKICNEIICGDCFEVLKHIADESIDAIITDPPYEMNLMGKHWDKSGISYNVKLWKECLRVLKPGAHLISFGGTRTYHRIACAIEDSGFEIRDMIEWVYSSGFPKSLDIAKEISKREGVKIIEKNGEDIVLNYELTQKALPYKGLGTALKPAHEPMVLARKPLSEKSVVDNIIKYGTGGINIDECRIPTNTPIIIHNAPAGTFAGGERGRRSKKDYRENISGRFPANVICQDDALNDGEIIKTNLPELSIYKKYKRSWKNKSKMGIIKRGYKDIGSKSKYFDLDLWSEKNGILYYSKASISEKDIGCDNINTKNYHPTVKPLKLLVYLVKLIAPREGMIVLDPFAGSGTTGMACVLLNRNYLLIEKEPEYVEIAKRRIDAVKLPLFQNYPPV